MQHTGSITTCLGVLMLKTKTIYWTFSVGNDFRVVTSCTWGALYTVHIFGSSKQPKMFWIYLESIVGRHLIWEYLVDAVQNPTSNAPNENTLGSINLYYLQLRIQPGDQRERESPESDSKAINIKFKWDLFRRLGSFCVRPMCKC